MLLTKYEVKEQEPKIEIKCNSSALKFSNYIVNPNIFDYNRFLDREWERINTTIPMPDTFGNLDEYYNNFYNRYIKGVYDDTI